MPLTTEANQILNSEGRSKTQGIPEQYWEIVERYRGELVNQGLAILGSMQDAEDVAQETFCEAFRHPERLTEAESLGAFLRTINRANALDQRRKVSKSKGLPNETATAKGGEAGSVTGGFRNMDSREAIALAIEELPPKYRPVVILKFWEHRKRDEIAALLDMPPGTVRRLIYEATGELHRKLKRLMGSSGV